MQLFKTDKMQSTIKQSGWFFYTFFKGHW